MPILDLQRRLVEVGRIRLGKKVPLDNGKSRPAKLDKFRLTSRDRDRLDRAAVLYGGTVTEWEGEWELYTVADAIPVVVVPGQALTQSYELWGQVTTNGKKSPVICLRRCDGHIESKSDKPCLCAAEPEMKCKPTTRLSVILTEVPGLGVWRLESHGWNAATELTGSVELLESLVASGRPVRARLRLDKREQPTAQGTRKFVVPVVDIDATIGQVLDSIGAGPVPVGAAPAAQLPAAPSFTPVPAELPAAPVSSIADQVGAAPAPVARRANAAEPLTSTGLRPRPAGEVSGADDQTASDDVGGSGDAGAAPGPSTSKIEEGPVVGPESPGDRAERATSLGTAGTQAGPSSSVSGVGEEHLDVSRTGQSTEDSPTSDQGALPLASRVALWCREVSEGIDDLPDHDAWRHSFLEAFSQRAHNSATQVPPGDVANLRAALVRFKRGELRLEHHGDGFQLVDPRFGWESTDPAGEHSDNPQKDFGADVTPGAEPAAEVDWLEQIELTPGVGATRLLNQARKLAHERGLGHVEDVDGIPPEIAGDLLGWLRERGAA